MNHRVNEAEAVVLFKEGTIAKTMMFAEFNTMLERQMPFPGFSKRSAKAAFIRFNASFHLTTAVLFYIDFDINGRIKSGWNIPLRHLADTAASGPDLGDNREIKLSCASQCSVHWHQRELWDAEGEINSEDNPLQKIRHLLSTNPPQADFAQPLLESQELNDIFELDSDQLNAALNGTPADANAAVNTNATPSNPVVETTAASKTLNPDRAQLVKAMKIIKQQQQRISQREQQLKATVTQLKTLKENHTKQLQSQAQLIERLKRQLQHERNKGVQTLVTAASKATPTEPAIS